MMSQKQSWADKSPISTLYDYERSKLLDYATLKGAPMITQFQTQLYDHKLGVQLYLIKIKLFKPFRNCSFLTRFPPSFISMFEATKLLRT